MQLHQAIYKIEKALSQKWCKNLIKYMDIQCTEKAKVLIDGKDVEDTSQRNVYTHGLNSESPNDEVYIEILLKVMNNCLREYTKKYSFLRECSPQDINLLKYKKGNFYKTHIDSFHTVNRQLSFIINLNEEYKGGDIIFFNPHTKEPTSKTSLNTGDLLMFPSNFLYPHGVTPITKGVRYSCVSWYA